MARCGWAAWRLSHAAVHREQLERLQHVTANASGAAPLPRVLIFVAREGQWTGRGATKRFSGGLADRFTGLISLLAFAIHMRAALLIDWPGLREAFVTIDAELRLRAES